MVGRLQILEQSPECLRVRVVAHRRLSLVLRWIFFSLLLSVVGLLLFLCVILLRTEFPFNVASTLITLALAMLTGWLAWVVGGRAHPVEWLFDRTSGNLTIVKRSLLHRAEQYERYLLDDVRKVSVHKQRIYDSIDWDYDVRLSLRSGRSLGCGGGVFINRPKEAAWLARSIGAFLGMEVDGSP